VEDGHQILGCLGRGECFGEIALISDTPRTATVRSKTGVNVLAVDRDAFPTLFATLPPPRGVFEHVIEAHVGGAPATPPERCTAPSVRDFPSEARTVYRFGDVDVISARRVR